MSVALTDCPKVAPLSEFICLSILALTFSQLFPRAARFSHVDRRDDWRHYRAAPTAPQPKQSTHKNAHTLMWMTGAHITHTLSLGHTSQRYEIRRSDNYPGLISIIMIHALYWKFKVRWCRLVLRAYLICFFQPVSIIINGGWGGKGGKGGL